MILMKILSTFNTELEKELVAEYKKQFWDDKVMSVHKSTMYYRKHIGLPIFMYCVLFIVSFYFLFRNEAPDNLIIRSCAWFFLLYGLVIFFKTSHKRVDYKMDFLIVTPREITKYDQSGMFNRQVEKLHADKIKSISISKPWFMNSVFDIWSITFMAEWDNEKGDITMEFVDAVEAQEKKMMHVLGMDRE